MKPMLADDWVQGKVRFPVIGQPKIDGVRGLNQHGGLTGRSLKLFKNRYTTNFYSHSFFKGFDGELAAERETHPDLCRLTTSAVGTIEGKPFTLWWLFDYINENDIGAPYVERYVQMVETVKTLQDSPDCMPWAGHLRIVPFKLITCMEELLAFDDENLDAGYEGTIIRDPLGKHKQGRSTAREGGLLRIKRFIEAEAEVLEIFEGESNQNDPQVNELGHQFRSSYQDKMVPNGLVGAMDCRALVDVLDRDRVVISKGQVFTVSAGSMPHDLRGHYFRNPEMLLGKTIKFKFFPKGIKDKPRFPTFVTIRDPADM